MTAKEKAIQIFNFYNEVDDMKSSAIFCVDQIIEVVTPEKSYHELLHRRVEKNEIYEYWQQVRKEIEKL